MRIAVLVLWFGTGFVVGCGGDDGGNVVADASGDAFESACGHPGDQGNDKGIGKFCAGLSDCSGNMDAVLCSSLGDPSTHFCTRTCQMGDSTVCGTGAECTCNENNQCGCTPTACL